MAMNEEFFTKNSLMYNMNGWTTLISRSPLVLHRFRLWAAASSKPGYRQVVWHMLKLGEIASDPSRSFTVFIYCL